VESSRRRSSRSAFRLAPMKGVAERFLEAALARDVDRMYELVDWGVTGAARMVRALELVDRGLRPDVARRGASELEGSPREAFRYRLGSIAFEMSGIDRVRTLSSDEVVEVVAQIIVPPPPEGLPEEIVELLDRIRERAARISEVVVSEAVDKPSLVLAIVPGAGRVALVN
jgi:hypothetical protein